MTPSTHVLNCSGDVWRLLRRSVTCVYKTSGFPVGSLLYRLGQSLTEGLNQLERQERYERLQLSPGATTRSLRLNRDMVDYAQHPLVLGDGYHPDDLGLRLVNPLSLRTAGPVLVTIKNNWLYHQIRRAKMLNTYRVRLRFGVATLSGWEDGHAVERTRNPYLTRPVLERALAAVQSGHQRQALEYAKVSLQSQAAYELAAPGPIRPAEASGTLVYKLQCIQFNHPDLELEVSCVNENEDFLVELVSELGLRLKTTAVCCSLRLLRYGVFNADDHALLLKHVDMASVIENTHLLQKVIMSNENLKVKSANFYRPEKAKEDPSEEVET